MIDAVNASGEMTGEQEVALTAAIESFKQTAVY